MYDYRILTFVKAAQHKSFSSAAEGMNLSTSAVTKQISTLEKEWKTVLFTRTNSGIELTEDGKYLYQKAIDMINEANTILAGLPSQKEIRIIQLANCHVVYSECLKNIENNFCSKLEKCKIKEVPYFNSDSFHIDPIPVFEKYDMMFYINEYLDSDLSVLYTPICYTPLMCAVKETSDLNQYSVIGTEELKGHTVGFFTEELSPELNRIRNLLEQEHICIVDMDLSLTPKLDYEVIIIPEIIAIGFTYMKFIPMTPEFKISAGIYSKKSNDPIINEFLNYCHLNFIDLPDTNKSESR